MISNNILLFIDYSPLQSSSERLHLVTDESKCSNPQPNTSSVNLLEVGKKDYMNQRGQGHHKNMDYRIK